MFKLFPEVSDAWTASSFETLSPVMRLLSFLTEIERAIRMEANADETSIWTASRIVNFGAGLARLTLTCHDDSGMPTGTILIQHYALASGDICLKASLGWEGAEERSIISVYETPLLNWKLEASRIATGWLAGPPAKTTSMVPSNEERIAVAS
jgi:hypothetical protein